MRHRLTLLAAVAVVALSSCATSKFDGAKPFILPYGDGQYYWSYPAAEDGALTVRRDDHWPGGIPDQAVLSLSCEGGGALRVEARALILGSDVPMVTNQADFTRLAMKAGEFHSEALMTPKFNGFETWSHGVFMGGAQSAPQLLAGQSLVVTAVNRKPLAERAEYDEDMEVTFPAPDWDRTATFRAGCAKVASGAKLH